MKYDVPLPENVPSFAHQKEARSLSRNKVAFGYLMEQGTGKSKTLVDDACDHYARGHIDALIVTAPNGVQRAWSLEHLPRHVPDVIPFHPVVFSTKMTRKQKVQLEKLTDPNYRGLRVLLINYEALRTKSSAGYEMMMVLLNTYRCMWALDESHRIKTWDAKSTRLIVDLAPRATMRRIMTGTPSTQGPLDLYPQMYFLDKRLLGFTSFTAFKAHYAELEPDDSRTMYFIRQRLIHKYGEARARQMMPAVVARDESGRPRYKNLDELQQKLELCTYRKLKSECLDLPEKVYTKRYVQLNPAQRTLYDALRDDYIAEHDGTLITAPMALTRLTRLQQITGGFLPTIEGEPSRPIGDSNPKIEEMLDAVEDAEGKVIIWARFVEELRAIADSLEDNYGPGSVARYWGEIRKADRDSGKAAFCEAGSATRFFVSQPQTGGTGLDGLQIAGTEIFYSNDFSLLNRLQAEDRGHRINMGGSLTIIDIEAEDTRDTLIIDSLRDKKEIADVIVGDPSKAWI